MAQESQPNQSQSSNAISPEVQSTQSQAQQQPLGKGERILWIIVAVLSGIYIISPVDFIPDWPLFIPGLIDDGMISMALLFALSKLGINIPLLSRFVNKRAGNRRGEKSVN